MLCTCESLKDSKRSPILYLNILWSLLCSNLKLPHLLNSAWFGPRNTTDEHPYSESSPSWEIELLQSFADAEAEDSGGDAAMVGEYCVKMGH